MRPEDAVRGQEWLTFAREDLLVARVLLDRGLALNAIGYHIQQAADKTLKGLVVAKGGPLRRIHDLDQLLDDAAVFHPALERHRELCSTASAFSTVARYPGIAPAPMDEDELARMLGSAESLVDDVSHGLR